MVSLFREFPETVALDVPGFGNWLIYAAAHGTREIVERLLAMGFDMNAQDKWGEQTPLSSAALSGKVEIAACLLEQGARLDTTSSLLNPLFGAIVGRSPAIAQQLLAAGIDTTVKYRLSGASVPFDAVAFAMERGEREIAKMIALHNAHGDEDVAEAVVREGLKIAQTATSKPS